MEINYIAVLLAALATMILGALWYSKLLFGSTWMRLIGRTEEEIRQSGTYRAYFFMTITAIIMAFVLAMIFDLTGTLTVVDAVQNAFWLWLGFIATSTLSTVLYENRSPQLYWIFASYQLVAMIIMGLIIVAFK